MTITKLCSELARREKTKSQTRIQAIRSIVGHLSDILIEVDAIDYCNLLNELIENGKRRARKKGKK